MNKKEIKIIFVIVILLLLFVYPTFFLFGNFSKDIKHETTRWAVIEDYNGNQLAIEPENTTIWEEIVEFRKNESHMYVGYLTGLIVPYDNFWQFRFEPSTITVHWSISSRSSDARIIYVANNLDSLLYQEFGINVVSISFPEQEYNGIIGLVIDLAFSLVAILIFSFYLVFTNKSQKQYELVKRTILSVKDNPTGISFDILKQKVDLDQKRVEQIISNRNLKEELGLQITDDHIQFKDQLYSKRVNEIEEQVNDFHQLPHSDLTLESYSELVQLTNDLDDALLYYEKDLSNLDKIDHIRKLKENLTHLLDTISFDNFK